MHLLGAHEGSRGDRTVAPTLTRPGSRCLLRRARRSSDDTKSAFDSLSGRGGFSDSNRGIDSWLRPIAAGARTFAQTHGDGRVSDPNADGPANFARRKENRLRATVCGRCNRQTLFEPVDYQLRRHGSDALDDWQSKRVFAPLVARRDA